MPSGNQRVRVFVKKQLTVGHLNFQQRQMLQMATVGLADRKNEIGRALNGQGNPAKPLTRRYAIFKTKTLKAGRGAGRNVRDLSLTGDMLREWSVRTVSNRQAVATWSTRKGRAKAKANNDIEKFINWSPSNTRNTQRAGQQIVEDNIPRMLLEKALNG